MTSIKLQDLHELSVKAFRRHGWQLILDNDPLDAVERSRLSVFWTDRTGAVSAARSSDENQSVTLNFRGFATASVSASDKTVHIRPECAELSSDTLQHIAMDSLLPRLISENGGLVLHAATVSDGAEALCFVGASGQGKSTLSAAMEREGWTLLGDDAIEIWTEGDEILARSPYRSLRLFPDSTQQLFGDTPPNIAPVADYLDKWRIDSDDVAQPCDPIRLKAVFVLGPDDGSDTISLKRMSQTELCMALIAQSFALDPIEPNGVRRRMKTAGTVASVIPGYEINYPRKFDRLSEVIAQINAVFLDNGHPEQFTSAHKVS